MSWPVHNGFKPIIDCITVHNNLYNNDWNDSEYTLTLFANIYYYTVTFNTVTDHTPVPIYTPWPYLQATIITPVTEYTLTIHLYLYTPWPYLPATFITPVLAHILTSLPVPRDHCTAVSGHPFAGWVSPGIPPVVSRRSVVRSLSPVPPPVSIRSLYGRISTTSLLSPI